VIQTIIFIYIKRVINYIYIKRFLQGLKTKQLNILEVYLAAAEAELTSFPGVYFKENPNP
jgi:hypothetical protein